MNIAQLRFLVHEDWINHGEDWTLPGFRAVALHRFGHWCYSKQSLLARLFLHPLYRFLYRYIRNNYGIELPWSTGVGRGVVIEHQGGIVIHGHAVIGNDCIIRQGVTLGNRYLDRPDEAPQLGQGVNVGAGAKILGAVKIGDFSTIGANAVVIHDVDAESTVVGIPAQPINRIANKNDVTTIMGASA